MENGKDWRETHFGVPSRIPKPKRSRWWLWLIVLPVLSFAGVLIADRTGLITMPAWWRSTTEDLPLVGKGPAASPTATGDAAARERQLRDRVNSRERGIALMTRERNEVVTELATQQRVLDEATARMRSLENTSTSGMSAVQIDNLRIAHSNAVAAAKNATGRIRQLTDRRESYNRRIATAESERTAALVELGLAPAATEATTTTP